MPTDEHTYAERMSAVSQLIAEIERCDDVDVALQKYDLAAAHLDACRDRVSAAQGKFEELARRADQ